MLKTTQVSSLTEYFTEIHFQDFEPPLVSSVNNIQPARSVDRTLDAGVVLVVDDDAGMRTMLETVLGEEGYTIRSARNGQEALEIIRQVTPVLILLDLMMPVMNGWQFLEELKKLPQSQDLPIILFSASRDLQRTARNSLVKAYLPKPFDLDKLLLYIEQYRKDA